jgi:hypothetical protein
MSANDRHAPAVIPSRLPRWRAIRLNSPVHAAAVTAVSTVRPTSTASSLVLSTLSRWGRQSSRFIMPPLFHSAPTKDAPITNAISASNAASVVTIGPKFCRKSNVGGRNASGRCRSGSARMISAQFGG